MMQDQRIVDVRHREARRMRWNNSSGSEVRSMVSAAVRRRDEFDDRQGTIACSAALGELMCFGRQDRIGESEGPGSLRRRPRQPAGKSKCNCKRDSWRHPYFLFSFSGGRQFIPAAWDHLVEW
jgi:hypothetical protein